MTDSKRKRMSLLDNLAQAGAGPGAGSMMTTNSALRSARDAVDSHRIWELDPEQISDDRTADRLNPKDVEDLRASIEAVGQTVPILVRRDPAGADRYLLVYGRRRLEAVRASERVGKVRAMIAAMDDKTALRAQASENTARRDLSFLERALFAHELTENGFGTQAEVAEVLNVTKSAISMALSVARAVGPELARAIGPAHGIGRPRWEALVKDLQSTDLNRDELAAIAGRAQQEAEPDVADPSVAAFEAVSKRLRKAATLPAPTIRSATHPLTLGGKPAGRVTRTKDGIRLDVRTDNDAFAEWLQEQASAAMEELHTRWQKRG
ncbi:plasmid partitioning protein RepB [Paracoccus litorisediminis]|uniref:Plasmid partitioning protein RepB n=1 Tax=Paracoccus litorisediminis TaxID=2006130 RepID=A0A844HN67_9RHOB|nr:plasmid partitioning protein RepB [Paracoccus litorisediminis]MTH61763.1 plasmid partitioning protein RepB [Paracoccus litorisediminis]